MKKNLIISLCLVFSFAFISCGTDDNDESDATSTHAWILITNNASSDITTLTVTEMPSGDTTDLLEGSSIPAGESLLIWYQENLSVTAYLTAKTSTSSSVTSPTTTIGCGQLADCEFDGTAFTNTIRNASDFQDMINENYYTPAKSSDIRKVLIKK